MNLTRYKFITIVKVLNCLHNRVLIWFHCYFLKGLRIDALNQGCQTHFYLRPHQHHECPQSSKGQLWQNVIIKLLFEKLLTYNICLCILWMLPKIIYLTPFHTEEFGTKTDLFGVVVKCCDPNVCSTSLIKICKDFKSYPVSSQQ